MTELQATIPGNSFNNNLNISIASVAESLQDKLMYYGALVHLELLAHCVAVNNEAINNAR